MPTRKLAGMLMSDLDVVANWNSPNRICGVFSVKGAGSVDPSATWPVHRSGLGCLVWAC